MAFWKKDDEGGEWEKYQKSKGREKPSAPESSAADEFKNYFKTVRQAPLSENESGAESETPGSGMLDSFVSAFKPDKPDAPEEPPEKCPWCSKDTQKGYLSGGRDGARWSETPPGLFVGSTGIQDEGGWLQSAYKVCWFCKDCRKIFFDTAGLGAPLGNAALSPSILNTMSDTEKASYAAREGAEEAPSTQMGETNEETEKGE